MKRALVFAVFVLACHKPAVVDDAAVDANVVAPAEASVAVAVADAGGPASLLDEEDEEVPDAGGVVTCPQSIQPGWCRHRCRSFVQRQQTKHAQRVKHAERFAIGKCGTFDVFAEDERAGDGGLQSGIIEYFDPSGALVAAADTRIKPCSDFGQAPTCTPKLTWEESRSVALQMGTVVSTKLPPEVIVRIARQNFGRFRMCAERAMMGDGGARPIGHVFVKIDIAADGSVSSAKDDGSDLPNKDAIDCIVRATRNLSFPQPEGGAMSVRLPMTFSH